MTLPKNVMEFPLLNCNDLTIKVKLLKNTANASACLFVDVYRVSAYTFILFVCKCLNYLLQSVPNNTITHCIPFLAKLILFLL